MASGDARRRVMDWVVSVSSRSWRGRAAPRTPTFRARLPTTRSWRVRRMWRRRPPGPSRPSRGAARRRGRQAWASRCAGRTTASCASGGPASTRPLGSARGISPAAWARMPTARSCSRCPPARRPFWRRWASTITPTRAAGAAACSSAWRSAAGKCSAPPRSRGGRSPCRWPWTCPPERGRSRSRST